MSSNAHGIVASTGCMIPGRLFHQVAAMEASEPPGDKTRAARVAHQMSMWHARETEHRHSCKTEGPARLHDGPI